MDMMKRIVCSILCVILTLGAAAIPALASEEPEEVLLEREPIPEISDDELVEEAEEAALPETGEEASLPEPWEETELTSGDMSLAPEEETVAEEAARDALPVADMSVWPDADPEDPLYAKYMTGLDGASYGSTWTAFTTREVAANETLRYGIDVSSWQGTVNWTQVAAAGVEFVIIRAAYRGLTSGTLNTDGRFVDYINGAKAAGIKVGVYVFSQAITTDEAVAEADYILQLVKDYDVDLPLVFDLEHYTGGRFTSAKLSRRAVTDICLAFCARIEQAGYESMVYMNPSMLNHDVYAEEIDRLWLANYTTQTTYTSHEYEYWQCSDIGSVSGISGNVDLDFWFEPDAGSGAVFSDVPADAWYYATVMQAYGLGIVNGMSANTFEPGGTATRGQVVTMIHRMAGLPSWTQAASFTDLTQSYYRDAVYWAAENNVVNGYSEETFAPGRAITRQELVTVLYRMAGTPETDAQALNSYTDADDVSEWARSAMAWAIGNGIVTGYGDATLRPGSNATRAEVCAILMRYRDLDA